jgi:hypothetical protein
LKAFIHGFAAAPHKWAAPPRSSRFSSRIPAISATGGTNRKSFAQRRSAISLHGRSRLAANSGWMEWMFDFLRHAVDLLRVRQNAAFMTFMQREIADLRQRYSGDKRLEPAGYKVYSQGDEDGIIAEIFRRIGAGDRRFVEFGCGDGLENNTASLLLQGWSGLWIDSLESNELSLKQRWSKEVDADKGYALVGCDIIGANAFVRQDLAKGHFAEPFTAENHYQPPRYYLTYGFFSGHPPAR